MKSKFFGYLIVLVLVCAVSVQATFAFANAAQKQVAAKNKVSAPKKKSISTQTSKNKQVGNAKNEPEQNSGDADMQKLESQLQKLAGKGTITHDQANTLIQSLRDITERMAEAFRKSSQPSAKKR